MFIALNAFESVPTSVQAHQHGLLAGERLRGARHNESIVGMQRLGIQNATFESGL